MGRVGDLRIKYGVNNRAIEKLKKLDPTDNSKYLPWLLSVRYEKRSSDGKYLVNRHFSLNKFPLVKELLLWFDNNLNGKVPLEYKDIYTFKSIDDFISVVSEIKKPSINDIKKQIRVVLDDEDFKIFVPLTIEASQLYGSGTKWCTTQPRYFKTYTEKNFLYYIIDKRTSRKFGCSVPLASFKATMFYNNEDDGVGKSTIEKVYGKKFFSKVIESMKRDYETEVIKIKKKKALESAIKRLELTKKEFSSVGFGVSGLDQLIEEINTNFQ